MTFLSLVKKVIGYSRTLILINEVGIGKEMKSGHK